MEKKSQPIPRHRLRRHKLFSGKKLFLGILLTATLFPLQASAGDLDENLKIIEPLLNKKWVGELKAPDGSAAWKTYQEYRTLGDGSVVKLTASTPEIKSYSEGYFYWDRGEQKIAVFIIDNRGIYSKGTATSEGKMVTIAGEINFPERKFDFKNTFEFTAEGKMIDRWFQNAFGPWRSGHVIEFSAAPADQIK